MKSELGSGERSFCRSMVSCLSAHVISPWRAIPNVEAVASAPKLSFTLLRSRLDEPEPWCPPAMGGFGDPVFHRTPDGQWRFHRVL